MEKDMRSDTEESDKDEEREQVREKEQNGLSHFGSLPSSPCRQRSGSEALGSRAQLPNGHHKGR